MKSFLKSSFGLVLLFILLVILVLSVIPARAQTQPQNTDFYFLIGIIDESTKETITLDVTNFTGRTIKVEPRLSVKQATDSIWLKGPGRVIAFLPGQSQKITFADTSGTGLVNMTDYKSKYVSVLYTITPYFIELGEAVSATRPIDGQYLRLELALPVTWLSFTAKNVNGSNVLEWLTASEKNSDVFEVERSNDAKNWKRVGKVKSAGTSTVVNRYSFGDYFPEGRAVYYRLKQVDTDGSFEYSKTVFSAGSRMGSVYLGFHLQPGERPQYVQVISQSGQILRTVDATETPMEIPAGYSIVVLITDQRKHARQNVRAAN